MDFFGCLQQKLGLSLKGRWVDKDILQIKLEGSDKFILFYKNGACRLSETADSTCKAIHIDQDLWIRKPAALLNRLAVNYGQAQRSYARQTVAARIDKETAMSFQDEHHLHASIPGKYRYGLFQEGELLSVAIFSGLRKMRHADNYRSIELIHFCQKGQHLVIGGLTKLLTTMIRDFAPNDIMTYIDRDWSDGEKFKSAGFAIQEYKAPQLFIINREGYIRTPIKKKELIIRTLSESEYVVETLGSIKMVKRL